MTSHWKSGLAALTVVALLAASCGDDDDTEAESVDRGAEQGGGDEGGGDVVEITATDYAYSGVPESVPVGARLALKNDSEGELHEIVIFRINDDVDLSVGELLELPEEESQQHLTPGPPAAVILAEPGQEGFAVPDLGDGTISEPGRYALVCFIPTGADPAEYLDPANEDEDGTPEVEGGPPHFTQGMFAELVVE